MPPELENICVCATPPPPKPMPPKLPNPELKKGSLNAEPKKSSASKNHTATQADRHRDAHTMSEKEQRR